MKKLFFALMMMAVGINANAMSYEQARNEALFLTDKMAYELNLTDEQYEAAYEINLDYLMGVTGRADVFGTYWERRNLDLSYILFDWQWNAFVAASYFYRPLYWEAGYWHFGVYLRYPHRDYFYFGRPHFYATYRGAHAWHHHGVHGYYHGHANHYRHAHREHIGMHDRWNRGDFRGPRSSSTRVTGGHRNDRRIEGPRDNRRIEGPRDNRNVDRRDNRNVDRRNDGQRRNDGNSNFNGYRGGRSNGNFNNSRSTTTRINSHQGHISSQSRVMDRGRSINMGSSRSSTSHSSSFSGARSGGSRSSSSFGGSRSSSSFSGGTRGGSFGGGSRGGSFSGGSHSGGGSHGHGGRR